MRKLSKSSELLWIMGTVFVALGVSICSKANLGVSMIAAPAFVISEALIRVWDGFTVGVVEYAFQGVLLLILFAVLRKFNFKFLFTFVVAVIYGYVLNFFIWVLSRVEFNAVWLRWVMLIVGDVITALGVASFFRTNYPLQVYELFVSKTAYKFEVGINRVKSIFDMSLLVISVVLALILFGDVASFDWSSIYYTSFHSIGLGTLLTTLINSPLIALTGRIIDIFFDNKPLFPKIENALLIK